MKWNDKIKLLRKNTKSLTQEKLGNEINVTRSQIAKYESGEREPDIKILTTLVKYFDITFDYLLGTNDFDLKRLVAIKKELSEKYQKNIPMMDVTFECMKRGMEEIEKEIKLENILLNNNIDIDKNLEEQIKRYEKINLSLIKYKSSKSKIDKIQAILFSLKMWGIYNDVEMSDQDINLINAHLSYIFTNINK